MVFVWELVLVCDGNFEPCRVETGFSAVSLNAGEAAPRTMRSGICQQWFVLFYSLYSYTLLSNVVSAQRFVQM